MADIKTEKDQLSTLENLFQQKRFSDALPIAKKASSDYPNSFQIKLQYVRILKEINKLGEAEEVLKELMLIYPNNIKLLLESGNLALSRNKLNEAFEFYNKILFLDPFNTEAKKSIEKIEIIKKKGFAVQGKNVDFISLQKTKLHTADTLPEFDVSSLSNIIEQEPPPPPPPPLFSDMKIETKKEQAPLPPPTPPPVKKQEMQTPEIRFKKREPEKEINLKASPPPIPDIAAEEDIPEILSIASSPITKEAKKIPEPPTIPIKENRDIEEKKITIKKPLLKEPEGEGLNDQTGFVTESAAKLYVEQGLLMDAVAIYEKLYKSRKEERYLSKITELKRQHVNQRKILVLNELLNQIKQKGEKIV